MFQVTQRAAEAIIQSRAQSNAEGVPLRVAAKKKEDKTFEYGIGFDEAGAADTRISDHNADIVIAPDHLDLLEETLMDFVEIEPGQFGFIFLNPLDANYTPPQEH